MAHHDRFHPLDFVLNVVIGYGVVAICALILFILAGQQMGILEPLIDPMNVIRLIFFTAVIVVLSYIGHWLRKHYSVGYLLDEIGGGKSTSKKSKK